MATVLAPEITYLGDLLKQLGDIPASRVRLKPTPGTATERDVIAIEEREGRLCELVDGTLVEKVMGAPESFVGGEIFGELRTFVKRHDLGLVYPADGMARVMPALIRIPDVSYYSWRHFPQRKIPTDAVTALSPDLAVEVVSRGNTRKEILRKLKEYFLGGTLLVWVVHFARRTARIHTAPDVSRDVGEDGALDGGDVVPGFRLPLRDLFAQVPEAAEAKPSPRKRKPGRAR